MEKHAASGAYVTTRQAMQALGVSDNTLRKWAAAGLIPHIRSPAGQRLYQLGTFIQQQQNMLLLNGKLPAASPPADESGQQRICYCRVSSQGQKDDLDRQVQYMRKHFPQHTIVTDIASGINFKRRGLRSIMALASKGAVSQVVVAYRDRLCRFAFELVEWILQLHGVELVVLNQEVDAGGNSELAEDLLAIINVFNCRVNGRRKYNVKHRQTTETENADKQLPQEHQATRQCV